MPADGTHLSPDLERRVDNVGMRGCFSTMGCPGLSLEEVANLALRHGISSLELRSLEGTTDLPALLDGKPGGWAAACELLRERGLSVPVLGTGFKLVGNNQAEWKELLDFAKLADALEVPYLRIFGGGKWGTALGVSEMDNAVADILRWRSLRRDHGFQCDILMETHDAFSATPPCVKLVELLGGEEISFIWDSHHTWRLAGEPPEVSWEAIGRYVRHVHIKDSVDIASARHPYTYVLPGTGQMPGLRVIEVLHKAGYAGAVSLEWEKMWHPYLVDLADALKAARARGWLG